MAAYPFAQLPTFKELREKLERDFGCKYRQHDGAIANEKGETFPVYYFERSVDGKILTYVITLDDAERALPTVIRNLCRRLKLDPKDLGLYLG